MKHNTVTYNCTHDCMRTYTQRLESIAFVLKSDNNTLYDEKFIKRIMVKYMYCEMYV